MQHRASSFGRGVWIAPWAGPNGETILVAIDREKRQVGTLIMIPPGGNSMAATCDLWDRLDGHDPIPILKLV